MSATSGHETRVGLLVLLGVAAIVTLVLVSDTIDFEPSYPVTVYLNDGEGLRRESPVTFSGLKVGVVSSVSQGDDPRGRVRAVASIKMSRRLPADTEVKLSSSGIFGDSFLAFSSPRSSTRALPTDGSAELVAKPGFLAEASSKASTMLDSVSALLDEKTRADMQRLIANAADLSGEGAALMRELRRNTRLLSEQLTTLTATATALATRMESTMATTDRLLVRLDAVAGSVDRAVSPLADGATAALAALTGAANDGGRAARALSEALATHQQRIAAALDAATLLAGRIAVVAKAVGDGEGVLGQLLVSRQLARDVHHIAIDAAALTKTLADQPSRVIFDADEATRQRSAAARERTKQERSLGEWLGLVVSATAGATAPNPATAAAPR